MTRKINPRDTERYDKSYLLFCSGVSQKEICTTLDINSKTLKRWIDDGIWKEKIATKVISLDAMINRLMVIADDMLNEEDFKKDLVGNSNAIAKLLRQIKTLKNGTTINDRLQTFLDFTSWVVLEARTNKDVTDSIVKAINNLQDKHIRELCDKM